MNRTNPIDFALFDAAYKSLSIMRAIYQRFPLPTGSEGDGREPDVIANLEIALMEAEKDMETNAAIADDNPLQ